MPKKKTEKEPRKRRKANGATLEPAPAVESAGIPLRLKGQHAGNGARLAVVARGKA